MTPERSDEAGQGATEHGQSEFRGIALAPPVLKRIADLQAEQKVLQNNQIPNDKLFPVQKFKGAHISMKFQTRSTEGILYYLGEIVRRNLAPEYGTPRIIRSKVGLNYGTYPMRDCAGPEDITEVVPLSNLPQYRADAALSVHCQNIFVVNQGPSLGGNVVTVLYNGSIYSVPHDPEHGDRSSQVMELTKQILNLNTSAKQLPSTTVISVVGEDERLGRALFPGGRCCATLDWVKVCYHFGDRRQRLPWTALIAPRRSKTRRWFASTASATFSSSSRCSSP